LAHGLWSLLSWQTLAQALIFATGIGGQLLVGRFDRRGFALWLASNALLLVCAVQSGLYGVAALYVLYAALCARAWRQWGRRSPAAGAAGAAGAPAPSIPPRAAPPACPGPSRAAAPAPFRSRRRGAPRRASRGGTLARNHL
jgi:hypothetical protein